VLSATGVINERRGFEYLRQSDRNPRCYEMTDDERNKIIEWQNRNVWNNPTLAEADHPDINTYYGE
jgi:hypothetical protein